MSTTLVLALPLALLGVVAVLGFLGCVFQTGGVPAMPFTQYDQTVQNDNPVAFWPLNDLTGTTAVNAMGDSKLDGTYTTTAPAMYDPATQSAKASGTFQLNQPGIVAGDVMNDDPNQRDPCASFDGGFVSVPADPAAGNAVFQALNPPMFSIEAWVLPAWDPTDTIHPAIRVVVASDAASAQQGFALFATTDNFWAAVVGTNTMQGNVTARPDPSDTGKRINFTVPTHLVATYDGGTLTLFASTNTDIPVSVYAQAPATGFQQLPPGIKFYIGQGHPDLPQPLLPFSGFIQDVALYSSPLSLDTVKTHFLNGSGLSAG